VSRKQCLLASMPKVRTTGDLRAQGHSRVAFQDQQLLSEQVVHSST
jgi:hypothetical protein